MKRIGYFLKHHLFFQTLYKVVFSFILRIMSIFIRIDKNLALFVSYAGSGYNDSPKAIYNSMSNYKELEKIKCVWAFSKKEFKKNKGNIKCVKIDSIKYFAVALKAKYWITNTNIERGLSFKRKKQIYLNTWHGIALKTIGNDCPGRSDYNFKSINFMCVSGSHDEKVFKSAFRVNELSYIKCGMPRNDSLYDISRFDCNKIKDKIGIHKDKKIILYAPTWRDSVDGGKTYGIKPPVDFNKWNEELSSDYVILFRAHHLTSKIMDISFNNFVIDVSSYDDVNELMVISDFLITDYSAIAFDYSILCKPIFVFAYDFNDYLKARGTYFNINDYYPNKIVENEDNLLKKIKNCDYPTECEKTKRFKEKFVQYGGNATQTCIDSVFGLRI